MNATEAVLSEVAEERDRQNRKWGEQNHPDGTGAGLWLQMPRGLARHGVPVEDMMIWAKARTDREHRGGRGTFEQILTEEWAEAIAACDPDELRAELIQVAAVAVAWVEKIDRRGAVVKVADSIIAPMLDPTAGQLYRDLLTAAREVIPGHPDRFDADATLRVGYSASVLVLQDPETAARVICSLLIALAVADRTLVDVTVEGA